MWTAFKLFFLSPLLPWFTGYSLIAIVGIGIFLLLPGRTLPIVGEISRRVANIAGIIGLGAILCAAHASYFFRAGEGHMAQRIAAKDAAAVSRVEKVMVRVNACNGGADWDATTGTCNSDR